MDKADRERIAAYLQELGGSDEEIAEVLRTGSVGGLALELVLRADGEVLPFGEAAARAGLAFADAARFWRALGFPTPPPSRLGSRWRPSPRCR